MHRLNDEARSEADVKQRQGRALAESKRAPVATYLQHRVCGVGAEPQVAFESGSERIHTVYIRGPLGPVLKGPVEGFVGG